MKTKEEINQARREKRAAAKAALMAGTVLAQEEQEQDVASATLAAQAGTMVADAVTGTEQPQTEPEAAPAVVAEKRKVGRPRINPEPAPRPAVGGHVTIDGGYVISFGGKVVGVTPGTAFEDETMLRAVITRYAGKAYPWQTISHDLKVGNYRKEGGFSF